MTMRASARQSSFGMRCAHCDNFIIAPAWTEHRNERHIRHLWHCWRGDCIFETVVDNRRVTTDENSGSRLVA